MGFIVFWDGRFVQRYLVWFGAGWTKALEFRWLRLFVLLAVFLKTYGSEDKWTFSAFFRCLVIEHPYMRKRVENYPAVKSARHRLREAVLLC